jgi:hypothetical protein
LETVKEEEGEKEEGLSSLSIEPIGLGMSHIPLGIEHDEHLILTLIDSDNQVPQPNVLRRSHTRSIHNSNRHPP